MSENSVIVNLPEKEQACFCAFVSKEDEEAEKDV